MGFLAPYAMPSVDQCIISRKVYVRFTSVITGWLCCKPSNKQSPKHRAEYRGEAYGTPSCIIDSNSRHYLAWMFVHAPHFPHGRAMPGYGRGRKTKDLRKVRCHSEASFREKDALCAFRRSINLRMRSFISSGVA